MESRIVMSEVKKIAAKTTLTSVDSKKEDEDTMVDRNDETKKGHAEMTMQQELPTDENKDGSENPPGVPPGV
jgi:hypothetical protein